MTAWPRNRRCGEGGLATAGAAMTSTANTAASVAFIAAPNRSSRDRSDLHAAEGARHPGLEVEHAHPRGAHSDPRHPCSRLVDLGEVAVRLLLAEITPRGLGV